MDAGEGWEAWLKHRWFVAVLTMLGMAMVLPAVDSGLNMDDFLHWSTLVEGARVQSHPGSPWGLFHFLSGDEAQNRALKASGELMWWTADGLRLTFWRPLTEWTHWLDYQLWPQSPVLMHLHSVLWYGALIALLGRLYRRLDSTSPMQAGLGLLFFVFSSLHLTAVTWIAARNQLLAACFMVICIGAFHLWRTAGSRRHGWIAAGSFALALLSAEAGLATLGYLVAHALVYGGMGGRRGPSQTLWRRLLALLPFLAIVVVWRVAYSLLGYGSAASSFYIDPVGDPARFIEALAVRLPTLLGAQMFGVSSLTLNLLEPAQQAMYAATMAGMVLLFALVARAYGLWSSPLARFLALGALLALVPLCAAEPGDRLLLPAEIGISAVLAMLLVRVVTHHRSHRGWLALLGKVFVGLTMFVHLVIFPLHGVGMAALRHQMLVQPALLDPLSLPDARHDPDARVVLLNPPMGSIVTYYAAVRRHEGLQNPASMHALANGLRGLKLTVLDEHTLELHEPSGKGFIDQFARDVHTNPFRVGEAMDVGTMRVTVAVLSPRGTPITVRFHFDTPLHDHPLRFYTWTETGYAPFALPEPGQSVSLPAQDMAGMLKRQFKADARRNAARAGA